MTKFFASAAALLSSIVAGSCSYRATQTLVYIDTNVAPQRAMSLSIVSASGDVPVVALRSLRSETVRGGATRPLFPGSFALVPKRGAARGGVQSLLARLDVEATATQPALTIERYHRVVLIERTPLDAYLRFNASCAARTSGCRTAMDEECTVSIRCIEQGLTCGDDGACVEIDLPAQPASDAGARFDAATQQDAAPSDITAPRQIAPLSTSAVTSKRPTLRWQLAPGVDGAAVELCRDRAMTVDCQAIRSASDHARPTADLLAGWWFWRLRGTQSAATGATTSAVWQFRVGARSANDDRDQSWGTWPDIDGDGSCDVVVGAQGAHASAGEVTVFRATDLALVEQVSLGVRGVAAGDRAGASVASLGDINGDGFADLAIGAPGANSNTGSVHIRFGGVSPPPDLTLNGTDWATTGAQFGATVAGLGDVDRDGYGDFVVGAPRANAAGAVSCGLVRVFFGDSTGVSARAPLLLHGRATADLFGWSASGVGDFNGDGFADLIVGAPGSAPGGRLECGEVHLFAGSTTGFSTTPSRVIECLNAGDIFGWSVSGAGDVNGDGLADLVVGAHNAAGVSPANIGGFAAVFEGAATAADVRLALTLDGDPYDRHGWSVSSAGDVNGDGFADIIVGAWAASPGARSGTGVARLYRGSPAGIQAMRARVIEGTVAHDMLGRAVSGVGDLNGDGYDDVVLGAPAFDQMPLDRPGMIQVVRGSATGLSATPWAAANGAANNDRFGSALATTH